MSVSLFASASDSYFSNVQGAFSKPADSMNSRIQNLAIALILLPILIIKDLKNLMVGRFEKVEPLTFTERLFVTSSKVAKTVKKFINKNQSDFTRGIISAVVSVGLFYLLKQVTSKNTPKISQKASNRAPNLTDKKIKHFFRTTITAFPLIVILLYLDSNFKPTLAKTSNRRSKKVRFADQLET